MNRRVGDIGGDFWLFDTGTDHAHAVLMHYHPDGSVDRREPVDDRGRLSMLTADVARVTAVAVPLNEFLANAKT